MTSHPRPLPAEETIPCEVCHKEIPLSEANHFEAEDYVLHFCGLDCYSAWKLRSEPVERQREEVERQGESTEGQRESVEGQREEEDTH